MSHRSGIFADCQAKTSNVEIARQLGVNRVTLYDWFKRGCPRGSVEDVAAWRSENVRSDRLEHAKRAEMEETIADVAADKSDSGPLEPAPRRRRKLTLQDKRLKVDTDKIRAEVVYKRLRNQEKRRELVNLTDVQREAAELAIRIKERLLAAPDEFETRFPAETRATNKSDFEEFIRILLVEIAAWQVLGEPMEDRILAAAAHIAEAREKQAAHAVS